MYLFKDSLKSSGEVKQAFTLFNTTLLAVPTISIIVNILIYACVLCLYLHCLQATNVHEQKQKLHGDTFVLPITLTAHVLGIEAGTRCRIVFVR